MAEKVTREVLEGYLECKYKGRLRLAGEAGEATDYQRLVAEEEAEALARGLAHLLSRHPAGEACRGATLTAADLARGAPLLLDATLEDGPVSLRCDALLKAEGTSRLGDFHYVPVLCRAGQSVRRQSRHLLALTGLVLGAVQGRQPAEGRLVRGPDCTRTRVKLTAKLNRRAAETLDAVNQMQAGAGRPVLTLNEHCRACEFRRRCHAEAATKDDLSLLRVMAEGELPKQRRKGIFTVTQLAYTFRPRRKGKRVKGQGQPHHGALQALAIRDAKTYVLGRPQVPASPTQVYLDLEGDANAAAVYLLGALVVRGDGARMHSFWADGPGDEERLLRGLLGVVEGEDHALFHFGSYERRFLKRMRRSARRKGPVDRLLARAVDVSGLIRSNVYFPVYANGLKDVAGHLGFAWSDPDASGLQSLVWRRRWEQTRDDSFKQRLLAYNAEDCAALRLLTEHLEKLAVTFDRGGEAESGGPAPVERVKASTRGSDSRKWGHTAFLLPEFERASRCAWFDYQREKVVARKAGVKATPPARRKKARRPRPTRRVVVRGNRCPGCKGRNVCEAKSPKHAKLFLDLKVSEGGVRRVVIKYVAAKYRCRDCGRYFLPRKFKEVPRFGHALKCWAVYQHVANWTSFQTVSRTLWECFGLAVSFRDVYRFKAELARRYRGTYNGLLRKIVAGNLLHADETGVQFKKEKGYVWAFTNLENVVFMCRPTREADFLAPLLKGFTGVLVSDFYKGYDSLGCPQQKCLVHLIRDLNGDLQANFHDEEFKGLAKAFGALLGRVVGTVDQHGLRKEHLQRHKADVATFFEVACGHPFRSEVAEGYRQRFLKYKDKLFTFLDHDGVPWHNNNAEHAIKHFAKYRMTANGRVTANGLQPYLVLLSIHQTCVYKKVNFLRFLLSGQQDVDAFVEAARRRRAAVRRPKTERRPKPEGVARRDGPEQVVEGPATAGLGLPGGPELVVEEPTAAELGLDEATATALGRKVRVAIAEIARKVVAGEDDPRLRWTRGRRRVRVLVRHAFPDAQVRGPALHRALQSRLSAEGWSWAPNARLHTYERPDAAGEGAEAAEGTREPQDMTDPGTPPFPVPRAPTGW
jgi:predicted RecB family nuclease